MKLLPIFIIIFTCFAAKRIEVYKEGRIVTFGEFKNRNDAIAWYDSKQLKDTTYKIFDVPEDLIVKRNRKIQAKDYLKKLDCETLSGVDKEFCYILKK